NSSGRLRDQLLAGLSALAPTTPRTLDVLVNKASTDQSDEVLGETRLRTWHPLPSRPPLVQYDAASADVCELCRQSSTATVISVSPRSFDGSLPAAIGRLTLSVTDARQNQELWEEADAVLSAIHLDGPPRDAVLEWRPLGNMSVSLDYDTLVARREFRRAAVR